MSEVLPTAGSPRTQIFLEDSSTACQPVRSSRSPVRGAAPPGPSGGTVPPPAGPSSSAAPDNAAFPLERGAIMVCLLPWMGSPRPYPCAGHHIWVIGKITGYLYIGENCTVRENREK